MVRAIKKEKIWVIRIALEITGLKDFFVVIVSPKIASLQMMNAKAKR